MEPVTGMRSQTHEMEILATDMSLNRESSALKKDIELYPTSVAEDSDSTNVSGGDEQAQYAEGGFGWTIVLCEL